MVRIRTLFRRALGLAKEKKTIFDTSIYAAGNIISQALGLFVLPVFTRYLSTGDYGIFNYTNSFKSIIAVVGILSLDSYVLRNYFERKAAEDKKELFGSTFLFIFIVNSIILCAGFILLPSIIKAANLQIPFHPYFEIVLINNFLESIIVLPLVYYRVRRKVTRYFILTTSNAVMTIIIGLVLVVGANMGLMGRFYGILITDAVFAAICLFIMARISKFSLNLKTIREGLVFSLPIFPAAFISMLTAFTDRAVLERYVPISDIGIYSVGFAIGTILLIVVRGFYRAIEPEIYQFFNEPDFNEKIVTIKNNFLMMITMMGCLLIIFCKELVAMMVAPEFYGCYVVIPFFVIASVLRGAKILADTTLLAFKKTVYVPFIVITGLAVSLASNLLLIPRFGIIGAAASSVLTFWILFIITAFIINKLSGIRWGAVKDTLRILLLSTISVVVMSINLGNAFIDMMVKLVIVMVATVVIILKFNKLKLIFLR